MAPRTRSQGLPPPSSTNTTTTTSSTTTNAAAATTVAPPAAGAAAAPVVAMPSTRKTAHYILANDRILVCPVCYKHAVVYEKEISKHFAKEHKDDREQYMKQGAKKYDYTNFRNVSAQQAASFVEQSVVNDLLLKKNLPSYVVQPAHITNTSSPATDAEFAAMVQAKADVEARESQNE